MSRNAKDKILTTLTYMAASIAIIILATIIGFIFFRGYKAISFNFIFGKYNQESFYINAENQNKTFEKPSDLEEGAYFSEKFGFAVKDGYNLKNEKSILIVFIDEESPLLNAIKFSNQTESLNETIKLSTNYEVNSIYLMYQNELDNWSATPRDAKDLMNKINVIEGDLRIMVAIPGGGIWGSIKTTLMMIVLTLVLAIPLGMGIALYLTEYARKNKIINILRTMIDMLTGVPSIVFGLVGIYVFFVFLKSGGPVIYGGSIVLVAILLPVIIRSTEESLLTVPQSLRSASLALGASKTQTIKKIIIPSALPGILTATILSIGRIIGESAALILVSGTIIVDNPNIFGPGTTLAVQIWKEMAGENPNIEFVSGISIIIIVIVLILNIVLKYSTKLLSRKFN
ncbi:MAG: phosphate transporter permease [Haloplasmataceae bacterium]|jgi:phosphate transport system permease protein|nr:phosphate transporter permease [Haloplasmataceae bacterium]